MSLARTALASAIIVNVWASPLSQQVKHARDFFVGVAVRQELRDITTMVYVDSFFGEAPKSENFSDYLHRNMIVREANKNRDTAKDFWGTPYRLEADQHSFAIVSAGPDGVFGTNDDIRDGLSSGLDASSAKVIAQNSRPAAPAVSQLKTQVMTQAKIRSLPSKTTAYASVTYRPTVNGRFISAPMRSPRYAVATHLNPARSMASVAPQKARTARLTAYQRNYAYQKARNIAYWKAARQAAFLETERIQRLNTMRPPVPPALVKMSHFFISVLNSIKVSLNADAANLRSQKLS
jgi:hypothetical protein